MDCIAPRASALVLFLLTCLSLSPVRAQDGLIFASGFENDVAFADVQWASETVLVDGAALDALESFDAATGVFTFDSAALGSAGIALAPGGVLLVAGTGLGRIDTVSEAGGVTTVSTTEADLADAIESGRLRWNIDFGYDDFAKAEVRFGDKSCSPSIEGLQVSFECGFDDYTLTMSVTGGRAQSTIEFLLRKGSDEVKASFTGTGTISRFNQQADIDYSGGEVDRAELRNTGLRIDLQLELAAAGSGSSDVRYEVPFPIFRLPFTVGPIPASVDIGAQALAILDVPAAASASATGKANFSYDGDSGLSFDGGSVGFTASTNTVDFSDGSFDSASLFANVEATFGIAVPRVALSVLGQELAYVLTGAIIRSILYTGPICKEARTEFVVQGGYGLQILGIDLVPEQDLVLNRERLVNPAGGCPQSNL